jgi:tRNA(His) 5'-end guanylyltransferase
MNLGDRIKKFYEDRSKTFLNRGMITIIRLDGKSFSKLTSKLNKPFDDTFANFMDATAIYLCENIQGAKFAYVQSDEITIVLTDFDKLNTNAWFDYNVQKMVSVSASLATAKFNQLRLFLDPQSELAQFDSRVFQVPNINEMVNTIIWRQQDCTRNSISMAASSLYTHKELNGKSSSNKQEMMFQKGVNWNDYKTKFKRGLIIKKHVFQSEALNGDDVTRSKWVPDFATPIFTEDTGYLYELIPTIK